MKITSEEFSRRFREALSFPFFLKQVCTTNIMEFVNAYSSALGCSEKSFLFSMISCTAACMGTDCYIELSPLWQEPLIIWTLVIMPNHFIHCNVAEHLKQELLKVQNEAWFSSQENNSDNFKKFIFDLITVEQLHDLLKINNGHGLGIYDSIRTLHKCMVAPKDTDILHRLHYGLSWFKDSQHIRSTMKKNRVNFSVISSLSVVTQTLNTAPNFQELLYQCFLTVCAEETHLKFSRTSKPETEKLKEIFRSILKLHSSGPIVYKLNAEAKEKFGQIHDKLTGKAKQMVGENKIFQPALSYLCRLSCVLHVLDNIIEAVNHRETINSVTWKMEISAANVSHAEVMLAHALRQRHALIEPAIVSVQKIQHIDTAHTFTQSSLQLGVHANQAVQHAGLRPRFSTHSIPSVPNAGCGINVASGQNPVANNGCLRVGPIRKNYIINNIEDKLKNPGCKFRSIFKNFPVMPCTASVSSAGIVTTNTQPVCENLRVKFNLPPSLSITYSSDTPSSQPIIFSQTPNISLLDISNENFINLYKTAIKKILTHTVSQISPSRCIHLKLIFDPQSSVERQKSSSFSFAKTFLKKIERMGFGICEESKHGPAIRFIFRKKKFSELGMKEMKILSTLGIKQRDYNKSFNVALKNYDVINLE